MCGTGANMKINIDFEPQLWHMLENYVLKKHNYNWLNFCLVDIAFERDFRFNRWEFVFCLFGFYFMIDIYDPDNKFLRDLEKMGNETKKYDELEN